MHTVTVRVGASGLVAQPVHLGLNKLCMRSSLLVYAWGTKRRGKCASRQGSGATQHVLQNMGKNISAKFLSLN